MAKLKWHNGPTFTSGPIYKLGGNSQVAPGAEYERRGRDLTSITRDAKSFVDLCSEFDTNEESIKNALERNGFTVGEPNDEVPGEIVRRIRYLFSGCARTKSKESVVASPFVGVVTEVDVQTRSIKIASRGKLNSNTTEIQLPKDFPLKFADGSRTVVDVGDLMGKRLALHFSKKESINREGVWSVVDEIYRIEVDPPPRLRATFRK